LARDDAGVRRLITIPISHFCEKARWALERAGLEYAEERHVQGVHRLASRRAGGKGTVPVLVTDGAVLWESEAILRYADGYVDGSRRLFECEGDGDDGDVLAFCRELDAGLGADGRRWIYAHMLDRRQAMLATNNQGVPAWEDRALRRLFGPATRWVTRELGIGPQSIREDGARVERTFDAIAERLADGRTYLFGERFTAADLTFACLAASVLAPPVYGIALPQPEQLHEPLAGEIRRFRAHPAGAFAMRLFESRRASRSP
jgi:glutathione S-transferase